MSTEFTTMMSFSFTTQTPSIRTMLDQSGDPWFVAKDVCAILEHSNTSKAVLGLEEDEKGITKGYTLGGEQEIIIINESGLYNLIFRSNQPQAKAFRKWVTSEVLPAIRKQGFYGSNGPITIPDSPEQAYALWPHLDRQLSYHHYRAKVLRDAVKSCLALMKQHAPVRLVESDQQMVLGGVLS